MRIKLNTLGMENALNAIARELEHIARQLSIQNDIARAVGAVPDPERTRDYR